MEYSLQQLTKNANIENITLVQITNQLNLIGLEVDNISFSKTIGNPNLVNIQLLIKIFANREDLLNEAIFFEELIKIFNFKPYCIWNNVKPTYYTLLKLNYESNSKVIRTNSGFENYSYSIFAVIKKNVSPKWIQQKLLYNGIEPQGNIFDFLTLVTLEWGHFFEFISKSSGEKYNGSSIDKDIVIKVYFGQKHQSNENFNRKIFQKSFLTNFRYAVQRLLTLLEISDTIVLTKEDDVINSKLLLTKNSFNQTKNEKILKVRKNLSYYFLNQRTFQINIFKNAGLKIACVTKNYFYFRIPTFRKDLNREIDILEEYTRFFGYDNFLEIKPLKSLAYSKRKNNVRNFTKEFFNIFGFREIFSNPLETLSNSSEGALSLTNPLNLELSQLRTSILPKLIEVFGANYRTSSVSQNYFEIGRVFKKEKNKIFETDKISGIFQLKETKKGSFGSDEWFQAKAIIEKYLSSFDFKVVSLTHTEIRIPNFFHKTRTIGFSLNNRIIGFFGSLTPEIDISLNTKYPAYIFEFNLNYFDAQKLNSKIDFYQEISRYPIIRKDISFLIDKNINLLNIKTKLSQSVENLKTIQFFDIYFSEEDKTKVSVTFRFEFQSKVGTLTNEKIEEEIQKITRCLETNFPVEVNV